MTYFSTRWCCAGGGGSRRGTRRRRSEDFEEALTYPDRFEMGRPYDGGREALALYHAGAALEALGKKDEARKRWEEAVARPKPGTALAYWQGLALRKLGRQAEAAKVFDELAAAGGRMAAAGTADFFDKFGEMIPEKVRRAEGYLLAGLAILGKGDKACARENLRMAREFSPNHLWAREMAERGLRLKA